MQLLRLRLLVAFAVLASAATVARAQKTPVRLSLVPDLRIDAKQIGGVRDMIFAVGPKGQIVTAMRGGWAGIRAFDSAGKSLEWDLPTGRNDKSEIGAPAAIGWAGDTMWVADGAFDQIALVDRTGKVLKSIERPTWVHPSWAERRKYPVFSRMLTVGVLGDQTMLVVPARPRSLIDTPGFDRSASYVLRATWDGAIRGTVARLPVDPRMITLRAKGCAHVMNVPFVAAPIWTTSSDGKRVTIVEPGVTAADSGTVRITTISDRGDTVFSKRYPMEMERFPQSAIDNYLSTIGACGSFTASELRDSATRRLSPFKSPITGLLVDRDYNTWVLQEKGNERFALLIDPRGDVSGIVTLPHEAPVAADRLGLWVFEPAKLRVPGTYVRYKLGPTNAQPPRSAPAAASSKQSRPPT
ncbi:MAG TPA: hypothetical protein VIP11_02970 [Gemmatimonadaceae bacterium]